MAAAQLPLQRRQTYLEVNSAELYKRINPVVSLEPIGRKQFLACCCLPEALRQHLRPLQPCPPPSPAATLSTCIAVQRGAGYMAAAAAVVAIVLGCRRLGWKYIWQY